MTLLIAGMALFSLTHMFTRFRAPRAALIARLGAGPYKGAYSLVALASLAMIVVGYQNAAFTPLYEPFEKARAITHAVMPFAFILAAGANMKSNLKRYVGHPLSLAVILWAGAHLTANGDLAAVVLFGGFALFALANMGACLAAGPTPPPPPQPRSKDLMLLVAGVVGYAAALWAHGAIFGVYVVG